MSNKIYFSKSTKRPKLWWIIRLLTKPLLLMPKSLALKLSYKLLMKPHRRKVSQLPENMKSDSLDSPFGKIKFYQLGNGPLILLSHGWSGSATQLFPLMEKIASSGYRAIAYDQLAHGQSSGSETNLFEFIQLKRWVVDYLEMSQLVVAIICHSMAGTAAVNALNKPYPLLLIAPVLNFTESLFELVDKSGVPRELLSRVLADIESKNNMQLSDIEPRNAIAKYQGKIQIIHDKGDQFTPWEESYQVAKSNAHVSLTSTDKLGHGKIIRSDQTWELFERMLGLDSSAI